MATEGSHLASRIRLLRRRNEAMRHPFSIVPTLIGALALVNVASAIFALMR
jgi:hypothetical protein